MAILVEDGTNSYVIISLQVIVENCYVDVALLTDSNSEHGKCAMCSCGGTWMHCRVFKLLLFDLLIIILPAFKQDKESPDIYLGTDIWN